MSHVRDTFQSTLDDILQGIAIKESIDVPGISYTSQTAFLCNVDGSLRSSANQMQTTNTLVINKDAYDVNSGRDVICAYFALLAQRSEIWGALFYYPKTFLFLPPLDEGEINKLSLDLDERPYIRDKDVICMANVTDRGHYVCAIFPYNSNPREKMGMVIRCHTYSKDEESTNEKDKTFNEDLGKLKKLFRDGERLGSDIRALTETEDLLDKRVASAHNLENLAKTMYLLDDITKDPVGGKSLMSLDKLRANGYPNQDLLLKRIQNLVSENVLTEKDEQKIWPVSRGHIDQSRLVDVYKMMEGGRPKETQSRIKEQQKREEKLTDSDIDEFVFEDGDTEYDLSSGETSETSSSLGDISESYETDFEGLLINENENDKRFAIPCV